ncbi:MAG: zinc ribbon domain-containing protein [Methanobacteriota archaeon]|nr:MAG: zinc ribbon domain-containing protein [Euryarchaeota archaeon]
MGDTTGAEGLCLSHAFCRLVGILRKCASCGRDNDSEAEHCVFCGKRLMDPGICPECGIANLPDAALCRICGASLSGSSNDPKAVADERPGYRVKYQACPKCGSKLGATQIECPVCGHGSSYEAKASRSLGLPMAAGVLLFIAGMINIFWGLLIGETFGPYFEDIEYCVTIEVLVGIIALPTAFLSMMRRMLPFVIVASVLTMASLGPFLVCSICGFSALVLLLLSAKEFD